MNIHYYYYCLCFLICSNYISHGNCLNETDYDDDDDVISEEAKVSAELKLVDEEFDADYYETTDQVLLRECLNAHNKYRKRHGSPLLKLDDELIEFARSRAIEIAISDGAKFYHPDNLTYGENLAWNSELDIGCAVPIGLWYDEWKLYNYENPSINTENGHFTQLVWANTLRLGCGQAVSYGKTGGTYTVCNYDPPGNWLREEKENVKRAVSRKRKPKPSTTQPTTTIINKTTRKTTRKPSNKPTSKSTNKSTNKPSRTKKPRRA